MRPEPPAPSAPELQTASRRECCYMHQAALGKFPAFYPSVSSLAHMRLTFPISFVVVVVVAVIVVVAVVVVIVLSVLVVVITSVIAVSP